MENADNPKRRRLNADEKRSLKAETLRRFAMQYARKAHAGHDPNDRSYSRDVERSVKHMKPEQLDALLREGDDEA